MFSLHGLEFGMSEKKKTKTQTPSVSSSLLLEFTGTQSSINLLGVITQKLWFPFQESAPDILITWYYQSSQAF